MARRSRLTQLPAHVRGTVDQLIADGATHDQIVARLRLVLGEGAPSRSAVGRYAKAHRAVRLGSIDRENVRLDDIVARLDRIETLLLRRVSR